MTSRQLELLVEQVALELDCPGSFINGDDLISVDIEKTLHACEYATQAKFRLTKLPCQRRTGYPAVVLV